MNREIFRIAVPNIVSSITVPLMGIFSTAIAGHWGEDSAANIGALAIGVSIFNFIYWNCSFVRMGTSGFTAQAFGAGDWYETSRMLARTVAVSLTLGALVLLLQYPLGEFSLWVMNGNDMVADYFYARVWAVPAGIMLFGLNGWFTGMQNAIIPMCSSITVNVVHVLCSLWFAFGLDMGIVGIAYAAVVAQWSGLLLSIVLLLVVFRHRLRSIDIRAALDMRPMIEFFRVNADIIVRTFCIVVVYTFFTAASARMDDGVILAVNTMLMQLFTLFSYMSDGFAFAAEALTGRYVGAREPKLLRLCVRRCLAWSVCVAIVCVAIYVVWWDNILSLFMRDNAEGNAIMLEVASRYVWWVILIPLVAVIPFTLDGVMVGATETHTMRRSMLVATIGHFVLYYATVPFIGNNAIWLAFTSYMLFRGVAQYFMSHRLDDIFRRAEQ